MKLRWLIGGAALSLASGWAFAQNAPESLLPPGFDSPPPAPAPAPAATQASPQAPSAGGESGSSATISSPVIQALPTTAAQGVGAPATSSIDPDALAGIPSLAELEDMTPEQLEAALNLKPDFDIPPGARRSPERVGVIDEGEGGLPATSLARSRASLVRHALDGNRGKLISRWGHILLRRALASRLNAPPDMNPADFAALRASLLLRMGEGEAARAIVQDVDSGNYTPQLVNAAFDSYIATADFTGICPVMITQSAVREDAHWDIASGICSVFRGDNTSALSRMDRTAARGKLDRIDVLLAQKYAGAAGKARRAVNIEWDNVDEMTPWRYGLALAVGLVPPENLTKNAGGQYSSMAALAPALGLSDRAKAADQAAGAGIVSSRAMVDLWSQMYADEEVGDEWPARAETLRKAYVLKDPAARYSAMQTLWNSTGNPHERYSRQVLTAFAAARLPVVPALQDDAPDIIASMLTAGLDRNAMRWGDLVEAGSPAWGLLVLAAPSRSSPVDSGALDTYFDDDGSAEQRKSAFLLAGLAGLGRIDNGTKERFEQRLDIDLDRRSRWVSLIDSAAKSQNPALVSILAGLGMQGSGWDKMTPRYLFNIVSALRRVGLEAEARMIAAEAVARA